MVIIIMTIIINHQHFLTIPSSSSTSSSWLMTTVILKLCHQSINQSINQAIKCWKNKWMEWHLCLWTFPATKALACEPQNWSHFGDLLWILLCPTLAAPLDFKCLCSMCVAWNEGQLQRPRQARFLSNFTNQHLNYKAVSTISHFLNDMIKGVATQASILASDCWSYAPSDSASPPLDRADSSPSSPCYWLWWPAKHLNKLCLF